jgi:hypothetical protein
MRVLDRGGFTLESAPDAGEQLEPVAGIEDAKKIDVMISLTGIFHGSIVSWTTRAFEATTWAVGIEFAVVAYVFVNPDKVRGPGTIAVAMGLLAFGVMTHLYLRAARRAHEGNRLGISKCEAVLGLYQPGAYLRNRAFFVYSRSMLASRSLSVLSRFHALVTATSIVSVLVGGGIA